MQIPYVGAALAAALVMTHAVQPAAATQYRFTECALREQYVAELGERFGEGRIGWGLQTDMAGRGVVVELFAAPSGSWTVLYSLPDGTSCLLAAGQGWSHDAGVPVQPVY